MCDNLKYKNKYEKYKNKYLILKQNGGLIERNPILNKIISIGFEFETADISSFVESEESNIYLPITRNKHFVDINEYLKIAGDENQQIGSVIFELNNMIGMS